MDQLEQLVGPGARGCVRLLVLQPTPYCNLDCSYCYLPHRNDRRRMSDDVLRGIATRVLNAPQVRAGPDALTIVWHGGEPMTLPPDWYARAFALLEDETGRTWRHAFQTNAVGVDDRWIALFRDWRVQLGVSLDGPAHLHDAMRKTRGGAGSHALTMAGIARLQAAGLPFHIISVLTAPALAAADELFAFFAAHGLRDLAFNIEETEGGHADSSMTGDMAAAYARFLRRFLARMRHADPPMRLREQEGVRGLIATPRAQRGHNPQTTPLEVVSVAADGGLSTFSPELLGVPAPRFDDFIFGNVLRDGLEDMLRNPAFLRLHGEIRAGIAACAARCAHFEVCGGGAPANKYFELGDCTGTETTYCRLTVKTALDAILSSLEEELDGAV